MKINNNIARGLASLVFAGSFLLPSALSAESQEQAQVKTLDAKIEYHESINHGVARMLKERGYGLCDFSGERVGVYDFSDSGIFGDIGILDDEKKIFASHIGRINFDCYAGTRLDKKWVVEVYGKENIPKLTELLTEIAEPYGVDVEVRLESEKAKNEHRKDDFYMILFAFAIGAPIGIAQALLLPSFSKLMFGRQREK